MLEEKVDTTGWSEKDIEALEAAQEELALQDAQLEAQRTAEAARRKSSAFILAELKEKAELARAERQEAERAALGEAELAKARAKHGRDKAALIPTLRGPIVLRAATQDELDRNDLRIEGLQTAADRQKVWRSYAADLVEYPAREVFLAIMTEFPGTWPIVAEVRDTLAIAVRGETAKKG
jgi:DNA gyrase/topoisomerase IV subunit B